MGISVVFNPDANYSTYRGLKSSGSLRECEHGYRSEGRKLVLSPQMTRPSVPTSCCCRLPLSEGGWRRKRIRRATRYQVKVSTIPFSNAL
ncbi:hypothetical protein MATL_G00078890 [Megalops atlanticus]|uniref:Uncharacterized protein n=1 Tax=Megalops atlanticus TaxID=7932 RepID=A0A9D3TCN7_MEGAT|nr:hypothetical protein MATL_G00078890 [Megalops atlanticus]